MPTRPIYELKLGFPLLSAGHKEPPPDLGVNRGKSAGATVVGNMGIWASVQAIYLSPFNPLKPNLRCTTSRLLKMDY